MSTHLRKLREIELYGFVSKQDMEDVQNAISQEDADEKELDELLEF